MTEPPKNPTGSPKPRYGRPPNRPFQKKASRGQDQKFARRPSQSRAGGKIEISPSRLEAAKALSKIDKGAKVSDVLESQLNLKPEDTALMRELVYGVTRQTRLLDYHLGQLCQSPFAKLPVEVRVSLRMGLYQLMFLDRVPAWAAVHESVNLVKVHEHAALSGFVNAVLRAAETKGKDFAIQGDSELDTLSLRYSHPTWLVKKWAEKLDRGKLEEVLEADNHPHPVYFHTKPGTRENVIADLRAKKTNVAPMDWPPQALVLKEHEGGLFSGTSFQKGEWIIQDWVPQAMLEMVPLSSGMKVWDVCAAPGGKTISLAWKAGEKGQILASEPSPVRLKLLSENLKRVGLRQIFIHEGAAEKLSPSQKFDLIWVDAPCSGTGVLSRRADLRWRLRPKDILEQAPQQTRLLEQVQEHLYPKGLLAYSTCSLENEENQEVIGAFRKCHPEYQALALNTPAEPNGISSCEDGLVFWPTRTHDGGFLSVLKKG